MNQFQIEIFLALAENNSFSQTAELLHTTQPTVSRQIKSLEEELGTCLFQRTRRRVQITKSGKAYCKLFKKWKDELNRLRASS